MDPDIEITRLLGLPIATALFMLAAQSAGDLTWRTSSSVQAGARTVATSPQNCPPADHRSQSAAFGCRPG